MKMKQFFKKTAALFLSAVFALSLLPATAFAATGDVGTVTFDYTYDANGNMMYYNSGAEINGYTAGGVGEPRHRMYVDGDTAFCIQPGVPLHTGDQLTANSSETWNALSDSQKKAVGLALLYGYQGNRDGLTGSDDEKWVATQTLIWEFVTGCRNSSGFFSQTDTTVYDLHFGSNYPNSGAAAAYDQIVSMLRNHNTVPSFMNGSTEEFEYSNGKYVLTLPDSNYVLSEYTISASDNSVNISQSGNTLTITTDGVISDSVTIKAIRNNVPVVSESAKLIAYGAPELQDVVTGVENADPVTAYLNLKTSTGSLMIVKTSEDGVVDGISFHITGEGIDQTVQTANGGVITLDGLRPGTFTVTEMVADLYEPQSSQIVTVVSNQTATVTFDNILKRGSLKVIKNSEDDLVAGVQFKLSGTSLSGHAVEQFAETNENGVAVFENVLISGDTPYVVEEINTGKQYIVSDTQEAVIEWNTESELTFKNILKKWRLDVFKVDHNLFYDTELGDSAAVPMLLAVESDALVEKYGYPYGVAQGDATLAGHTYGVFDGDTLIDTYVTDGNGYFLTDYYPCGENWNIREISVAENGGYLLSDEIYWMNVGCEKYSVELNTEYLDVTEYVIIGKISIIKHADDGTTKIETPEVGAEFEVYLKSSGSYEDAKESERDYLICDENGFAETKWLPYGTYVVHQVSGKEGCELLPDFEVFISEDGRTYRYLANNSLFESHIKIVKTDAESGNVIPCANVGFEIYTPEGEQITMTYTYPQVTEVSIFYTNDEGFLITPEPLEYGKGYYLVEVSAPENYVLDPTPVYFDVVPDDTTDEDGVKVIEVLRPNMPQKGIIKISKTGEVFATVTEADGVYQPVYEMQGLAGAVYDIIAAEDIYSGGVLRYAKGEVVDTITTLADAPASSIELYLGKYTIVETKASYGTVLNTEPKDVELTYAGQEVEITEIAADMVNERQKAIVSLTKDMEQDDLFGIGNNGEISAVSFGLYVKETLTAADGTEIPAGALLEIATCAVDGSIVFTTDIPVGAYLYIKEYATDGHYKLSDTEYPVVYEYADQTVALVEIKVNNGEAIHNELKYGSIHGLKRDEDGNLCAGAVFGLFLSTTEEFAEANALMLATSGEDGSFAFEQIPVGDFIVRELETGSPAYVLNETLYPVSVTEDGQIIEFEVENKFVRGSVQLTKVDADYPDNKLTGAEFEIFRDSNGNKELDADDESMGLMTEISTGVYELNDLRYGGFFAKELTAPEGFYLDENAYYFEIIEDGKTVIVENEAGKGFVNQPQVGSIKIIKTSSGGKVEGFSFRVTGPNGYDEVFVTDANGEILIENLRIGDGYVISEVDNEAADGYILPADKTAAVFEGAVTKVEMHNEREPEPVIPDNPKTGDSSNLPLWFGLMGISAAGVIGLGILSFRNKKKKEDAE